MCKHNLSFVKNGREIRRHHKMWTRKPWPLKMERAWKLAKRDDKAGDCSYCMFYPDWTDRCHRCEYHITEFAARQPYMS